MQKTSEPTVEVGYLFGYALSATVLGTVAASWWALKKSWLLTSMTGKACMKVKMPSARRKLGMAAEQPSPAFSERAPDLSSSTMQEKVLDDGAILRIFFYPKAGVARRRLIQGGERIQMEDLSYSDKAKVIEQTLVELKQANKAVLGTGNTAPVVQNSPMPAEKNMSKQKPDIPIEMQPPKKEVSYRGMLAKCGVERREDVSLPYDCYCIHLADQLLGVVNKLWGTDLQRAVQQAGVEPGDTIEVSVVGETPVFSGGKAKTKKVWSIVKLK